MMFSREKQKENNLKSLKNDIDVREKERISDFLEILHRFSKKYDKIVNVVC